ncbi:MAG: hypothetical protein LBS95_02650 [Mycoplasmataceae bacterium]|jgi:uncharacterized protein (DUF342 family)|nr:hypothetical protein [Mycoplasmataceae bacterium]
MKNIGGKFTIVQDNKNLDGKNFSAQIQVNKRKTTTKNGKIATRIKKPRLTSFQQMVIDRFDKIDKRLNKLEDNDKEIFSILKHNNLK